MPDQEKPEAVSGNVALTGYLDLPADRQADVMAALDKHIELTRTETGCRYFSVAPAPDQPSRLLVSEIFDDRAAFDFHQQRAGASVWADVSRGIERHFEIVDVA